MRLIGLALVSLALLAGCNPTGFIRPPVSGAFYYPTGIEWVSSPTRPEGTLYVAGSNFDKPYDSGLLTAVDVASLGLPPFGTVGEKEFVPVKIIPTFPVGPDAEMYIDSFATEMRALDMQDGRQRLFIATQSEGSRVQVIDARDESLDCVFIDGDDDKKCFGVSPSLVAFQRVRVENFDSGKPAAPGGNSLGIARDSGEVFVAHQEPARTPPEALTDGNPEAYVVRFDGKVQKPEIPVESYISVASLADGRFEGTSAGVAVGNRYAFVTGRGVAFADPLRLVDRRSRTVVSGRIGAGYQVDGSRGVALAPDGKNIFVVGRAPNVLIHATIADPLAFPPVVTVVRATPIPNGPGQVVVVPRTGRGNLVLVVSTGASLISLYDEDLGQIVREISGLGFQPGQMAYQPVGAGIRLFVSGFGTGHVYVVDIADLNNPGAYQVVAQIGQPHACTLGAAEACL